MMVCGGSAPAIPDAVARGAWFAVDRATERMARIWAEPPTRETEMPTLIAGRTPE